MAHVFISHSTKDKSTASRLYQAFKNVGATPFLAPISIRPGALWKEEIFRELASSEWVFFLASESACKSSAVQQEIGAALSLKKQIIPLLLDIDPSDLPGFLGQEQAIDLRTSERRLHEQIQEIGRKIQSDRLWTGLILGAVTIAVLGNR